jgi:hypothetical protein
MRVERRPAELAWAQCCECARAFAEAHVPKLATTSLVCWEVRRVGACAGGRRRERPGGASGRAARSEAC